MVQTLVGKGAGRARRRCVRDGYGIEKTELRAPFSIYHRQHHDNGGHQAPVLLLQILPACGLALQGGQCQLNPLGVFGIGLLEVLELGRDYGVILHIDEGAGQVGGEP